jgi:predicted dehydrogenase
MSKVRWGLLSTANINKALIPAIRASRRGELVAVASRDHQKAAAYAKKWDIPQSFGDYHEMLTSGAVDAVYNSLPNHLHAEWSIKALQTGVNVLCEKPFATTLEEVDAMIAAKQKTGKILAEAFMYRHHPQTKMVGEWIREGRLGEITVVRGVFNFNLGPQGRRVEALNVRLAPEKGGGCLWDVGVYPLSFAQYVFGSPPEWVFGSQWIGETGVDEVFCGQMGYSGGGMAQISCSFRTPFHTQIEIIGTEGRLTLNRPFANIHDRESRFYFYAKGGKNQRLRVPKKELYLGEVEDMHAAILDGKPNYLSLDETRNHIKTVLALYESAKTERIVSI